MEQNVYFERCIDFLARMIEKYGDDILPQDCNPHATNGSVEPMRVSEKLQQNPSQKLL